MNSLHLKLVTLTGTKFEGDVYEVTLPTIDGEIGVLPGHMPLISVAKTGVIAVRKARRDTDREREYYATAGGVIEIADDNLTVIVDEADHAADINKAEAEAAHQRALEEKAKAGTQVELDKAHALIDRHAVRLRVADLHHRHRR
ncbi:MAG TPA: ATP synthase F1 subunit epsilon [Candidatus Saccharimonadales bacterium]|nr:ATP synthase F1 subunit epsilon [Candidatus Saccharimonadales bacterium]